MAVTLLLPWGEVGQYTVSICCDTNIISTEACLMLQLGWIGTLALPGLAYAEAPYLDNF